MPKTNSSTPSFHGSNSSHSKDSGQGGHTYHVPNYATSYANEKSHLISVTFDEDKGAKKTTNLQKCFHGFPSSDILEVQEQLKTPIRTTEGTGPSPTGSSGNPRPEHPHLSIVDDAQTGSTEMGNFNGIPATRNLYWGDLKGDAYCLAYGTRRYTARLRNVPFWANRTQACKETAIQINGLDFRPPDQCEVKWPFGIVKGHWNMSENGCTPVWGKFTDKGCIKKNSQKRLWNIKKGENRRLLCESAPAYVAGTYRSMPDACEDQGFWGTYGSWIVEDQKC